MNDKSQVSEQNTSLYRLRKERDAYKAASESWMKDHDALKAKYEPIEAVLSDMQASEQTGAFPEKEFKDAVFALVGQQAKFDQNGDAIDPVRDKNIGWSVVPSRAKDCRKGAIWAWNKRGEVELQNFECLQNLIKRLTLNNELLEAKAEKDRAMIDGLKFDLNYLRNLHEHAAKNIGELLNSAGEK